MRSEAQLSLRSTPSVEWPRYTKGNARIGAGLEGSFFSFGEASIFVLNLSCERGIDARLQSEPMEG